jgi:hypothetical protein
MVTDRVANGLTSPSSEVNHVSRARNFSCHRSYWRLQVRNVNVKALGPSPLNRVTVALSEHL